MNAHLTNKELLELLDPANKLKTSHLEDCATCRDELEILHTSLAGFRLAATSYAERHAPADVPACPISTPASRRFQQPVAWAAGLVAAVALCTAGVSMASKYHQPTAAVATLQPPAEPQKTAVSDEDATLLEGIDRDLSTSVPPSLQPLDVISAIETTSASK